MTRDTTLVTDCFLREIISTTLRPKALASIRTALISHGESQFAPPITLAIIAQDQCKAFNGGSQALYVVSI